MRGLIGLGLVSALMVAPPVLAQRAAPVAPAAPNVTAETEVAKRYVAEGKVPGIVILTGRGENIITVVAEGRVASEPTAHVADADSLWRVYSMTKPITGIAAMILLEEGKIKLDEPISDFIPAFKDVKVLVDPEAKDLASRPAHGVITIRHLLTHTAGFSYSLIQKGPLAEEYARRGINPAQMNAQYEVQMRAGRPATLEEFANRTATLPLLFDPGTKFSYSIGLDILGRVIEVASGMPFDSFVNTRILQPLKMNSSYWTVPTDKIGNFATNYMGNAKLPIDPAATSVYLTAPSFPYGGAGLVTSARDYERFLHMLANGGELDGARILKPETVKLAMSDLLPAGVDKTALDAMTKDSGVPIGFGAGGSVYLADAPGGPSKGTYGWGGAAGTIGWVDPVRNIRGVVMINLFGDTALKRESARAIFADLGQ
jgi:CubicO group peptidase (beta-lactamase class C family)